jgi:hypothetical protein
LCKAACTGIGNFFGSNIRAHKYLILNELYFAFRNSILLKAALNQGVAGVGKALSTKLSTAFVDILKSAYELGIYETKTQTTLAFV